MKTLKVFFCVMLLSVVAYLSSACEWTGIATATVNTVGTGTAEVSTEKQTVSDDNYCATRSFAAEAKKKTTSSKMGCSASVTSESCIDKLGDENTCTGQSVYKEVKDGDETCSASNKCKK
jgi:hypothetical protein